MMIKANMNDSGANHPRKIFRRERWCSLNGEWDFLFDNSQKITNPYQLKELDKKIKIPFAPETSASGIGDTGFHPRCWYKKEFELKPTGKQIVLHFGAVDYQAQVWLNDKYIGGHEGGHTPFQFDITAHLDPSGKQTLYVRADDDPADLSKPRGKQDWQLEPHSIWYPRTTGIWQTVWLEEVSDIHIHKIRCTPHIERWEVGIDVYFNGVIETDLELRVTMSCRGQVLAKDRYSLLSQSKELHRRIALADPGIEDYRNELLWSPERPTLIDMEYEVFKDGEKIDHIYSYTAMRSVASSADRFQLNGRPYYLRLVLDQGYWPDTFMTPPSEDALKKDISLIKAMGFNGVRKHQKVEDPNFMYWADVMGLVVWGEMPSAYRFTHESVERVTKEWVELIDRDINHPCIVTWVPFNESWGVPDLAETAAHQHCVQALYHLTKTLDPSRPCIGNDGWESTATDILGIHDYDDQPNRLLKKYASYDSIDDVVKKYRPGGRMITVEGYHHKGEPVMLTEFGGISFVEPSEAIQQAWGYSAAQSSQEFRKRYEDLMNSIHRIELFAGFCYTQLTDTFQETNGLLKMDRTPKFNVNAMARATRGIGLGRGELSSVPQPPPIPHDNEPTDMCRELLSSVSN
jgi:beta-galactosidase/beta-glucuronidase